MSDLRARLEALYAAGHAAPAPALLADPRLTGAEAFAPASVLIAITDRAKPGMLLLHRPTHMRAHPGQIALPGGRSDPGEDAVAAALRETQEELGIDPALVHVIGATDRFRARTGYDITPVLALVPGDIAITPNPHEVAQWFEAPVAYLLDPANHRPVMVEHDGHRHPVIEIVWQGHRIWGVTAAIIVNLALRLRWHG